MKRSVAVLLAGRGPRRRLPAVGAERRAGDRLRFRRQSADAARRHLSRRSRRRGDQFQGRHLRLHAHRPSDRLDRHRAPLRARRLAAVPVRSHRQVRPRDRQGHLRLHVRPAGAHRSAGQHLGGRSDDQHGDQVRSRQAGRPDAARPQSRRPSRFRRAPAPAQAARRGPPGAGRPTDLFNRPTDVAWDGAGNIFVADGLGNARVAKFDKRRQVRQVLGLRRAPDPGSSPPSAASRSMRRAMSMSPMAATSASRCSTTTAPSRPQFTQCRQPAGALHHAGRRIRSSTSRIPIRRTTSIVAGEIYKMRLDGTIIGKFGRAGQAAEGVRHRQRHRLPQREHSLRRRDRQSAGAEAYVALAAVFPEHIRGALTGASFFGRAYSGPN